MTICPNCKKQLEDGTKFCDSCGAQIPAAPAADAKKGAAAALQNIPKKYIQYGGIAAAAIILLIIIISLCSGSSSDYGLYLKDNQLYLNNFSKDPFEVTSKLAENKLSLLGNAGTIKANAVLSKDGSLLFFIDKLDSGTPTLYYRNVNKPKKEAVKVAANISFFTVNEDATLVTYRKDGNLYQYSLKKDESEKVASEISNYYASKDGKKLLYTTSDDEIYYRKAPGKTAEKLESDADIEYVTENFKTFYFMKEDVLYKEVIGKDKEKIASEIKSVLRIYDSGEMYYTKTDEESTVLCYFDGKTETELTDEYSDYCTYSSSDADRQILVYTTAEDDENKYCIAVGAAATELGEENINDGSFDISPDCKTVYFIADVDSESNTLYKMSVSKGKVSKPEAYDEDVSSGYFISDDRYIYFKDYKDGKADLYINKTLIDSDVRTGSISSTKDGKKIVYFTDWNGDKSYGTLKISTGKKPVKVADDVSSFTMLPNGYVLYLYDYSMTSYRGDLYLCKKTKPSKKPIDTDVVALIDIASYEDKSFGYYINW